MTDKIKTKSVRETFLDEHYLLSKYITVQSLKKNTNIGMKIRILKIFRFFFK